MNLLRVELSRFYARVLLWCVSGGLILVSLFVGFVAWNSSTPPSAAEVEQARSYYDQAVKDWAETGDQQIKDCEDSEAQAKQDDPTADYGCDTMAPKLEYYLPYTPTLDSDGTRYLGQTSLAVVLAIGLMSVSFVAAEFSSGAIGNWLTFAPRRTPVFVSKLGAALIGSLPATILALAVAAGGVILAFSAHGLLDAATGEQWATFRDTALRILVLAPIAAASGVALAFLLRHTAAVLGVVIGWAVLWEGLLGSLVQSLRPYTIVFDIAAWVEGGTTYYVNDCSVRNDDGTFGCRTIEHTLHMTQAGLQLGGLVVVLVVVALLVFRRRDVA